MVVLTCKCGEPITEDYEYTYQEDIQRRVFCCPSCLRWWFVKKEQHRWQPMKSSIQPTNTTTSP